MQSLIETQSRIPLFLQSEVSSELKHQFGNEMHIYGIEKDFASQIYMQGRRETHVTAT